jgi:acyl-CoA thioesterase YciA
MADDSPARGELAIRTVPMPADANPSGDVFGGWIMSQMDTAGATVAFRIAGGRVATVGVKEIAFHEPVSIGDEVSCYAALMRVGRTSIATKVQVWKRARDGDSEIKVTEGEFTYVAIDSRGRPRPVSG